MGKFVYIFLFIVMCFSSFSTGIPKDTTKFKFRIPTDTSKKSSDLIRESIRRKKVMYVFDGNDVHLIFDTHYVDTVKIIVYHSPTMKKLSSTAYLLKKREDNIEFLVKTHRVSLLIFVVCGIDTFIYKVEIENEEEVK